MLTLGITVLLGNLLPSCTTHNVELKPIGIGNSNLVLSLPENWKQQEISKSTRQFLPDVFYFGIDSVSGCFVEVKPVSRIEASGNMRLLAAETKITLLKNPKASLIETRVDSSSEKSTLYVDYKSDYKGFPCYFRHLVILSSTQQVTINFRGVDGKTFRNEVHAVTEAAKTSNNNKASKPQPL
jgi:hypothetical protein